MSLRDQYSSFAETKSISYAGTAAEFAVSLNRGTNRSIKRVHVYWASATPGSKVSIIRKASASTANERTPSHADSKGVLLGEIYLANTSKFEKEDRDDFASTGLRLYIDGGSSSGTIYVTVEYEYDSL